jgi:hypothetical protein
MPVSLAGFGHRGLIGLGWCGRLTHRDPLGHLLLAVSTLELATFYATCAASET